MNRLGLDDEEVLTLKLTRKRAATLGLLHCKHCGLPPNNHFNWAPYKCAHDPNCTGYEEVLGKV